MSLFAAWVFIRFESMQEQADFNTTTTLVVLAIVAFKTVIDLLLLKLVFRQASDTRVVMTIVTQHVTGTARKIEDTNRHVGELHKVFIEKVLETGNKIEEVKEVATNAACRLEQKMEEVKKADGNGGGGGHDSGGGGHDSGGGGHDSGGH